ncbi:MAG: hypothetical protein RL757_2743 [Bacteroidota bacterium]|jgi:hypothetical protein
MKKTIIIVGLIAFASASSWAQKRTTLGIGLGFGVRPDAVNFSEFKRSEQRNWSVNVFVEHRIDAKWYLSSGLNFVSRNFYPAHVSSQEFSYVQLPIQLSYELKNGLRLGGGLYAAQLNPLSQDYQWLRNSDRLYDGGLNFQANLPLSSRFRLSLQSELGLVKHRRFVECTVGSPYEPILPRNNRYIGLQLGFRLY